MLLGFECQCMAYTQLDLLLLSLDFFKNFFSRSSYCFIKQNWLIHASRQRLVDFIDQTEMHPTSATEKHLIKGEFLNGVIYVTGTDKSCCQSLYSCNWQIINQIKQDRGFAFNDSRKKKSNYRRKMVWLEVTLRCTMPTNQVFHNLTESWCSVY